MKTIRTITARQAASMVKRGSRIYVAGCLGEPGCILDAVEAEPGLWQEVTITGTFVPGVNTRQLAAIGTGTRVETIFATEGLAGNDPDGRIAVLPLHYSEFDTLLARPGHVDIAFFEVPPPRGDGTVGLGLAADFTPAAVAGGAALVGVINASMPDVADGPRFPVDRFAAFVAHDHPLPAYDPGPIDAATGKIAGLIAAEIRPGDTVQLGLGKVQAAVLSALRNHRDLGFHAGMISTPIRPLVEDGVFGRGVTTGVALGGPDFLAWAGSRPGIAFRPVSHTHSVATLSAIGQLVSVNSVIEVDLFGQANADTVNGRQVSGQGGLVDFLRGARLSPGGRSIVALPSTARGGATSRIVASLGPGVPATVSRADIDIVITEHGVARLRHASRQDRARQLIAIAAPQWREHLATSWRNML